MSQITSAMWAKAQSLIAADAQASFAAAGNRRGRKHRSYSLTARASALVEALGSGDAERVAAIMLYEFTLSGRSNPLGV